MYDTMHADLDVPVAILTASEATIYGRFGYGSATVTASVRVDRRAAVFRPDAPDPGGVRIMSPADAAELLPPRGMHGSPGSVPMVVTNRTTNSAAARAATSCAPTSRPCWTPRRWGWRP